MDWIMSTKGFHRWGDEVYYDPETDSGYQLHHGRRISALSFAEFGENALCAEEAYEAWLDSARNAWAEFTG